MNKIEIVTSVGFSLHMMKNIIALEQHIQQRAQGTTVSRTVCPKQATFYAFRMREIFNASLDCVM
jgi:hypothetical protein